MFCIYQYFFWVFSLPMAPVQMRQPSRMWLIWNSLYMDRWYLPMSSFWNRVHIYTHISVMDMSHYPSLYLVNQFLYGRGIFMGHSICLVLCHIPTAHGVREPTIAILFATSIFHTIISRKGLKFTDTWSQGGHRVLHMIRLGQVRL